MTTVVWHFSEDPSIERFLPHVPVTNPTQQAAVCAIDETHAPLYWFPRDCPRGTVWARDEKEQAHLSTSFDRSGTPSSRADWSSPGSVSATPRRGAREDEPQYGQSRVV